MNLLGGGRVLVREIPNDSGRGILEPPFEREPISFGFGYLVTILVEKEFIGHQNRRFTTQCAANFFSETGGRNQVLAMHFIINVNSHPTGRPVRLPLKFAITIQDRMGYMLLAAFVGERHIAHMTPWNARVNICIAHIMMYTPVDNRQERKPCVLSIFVDATERRENNALNCMHVVRNQVKGLVISTRLIGIGGRQENVIAVVLQPQLGKIIRHACVYVRRVA